MRKLVASIVAAVSSHFVGCHRDAAPPANAPRQGAAPSATEIRTTTIDGFDSEGEPEIREMSDGSLYVVFNFMPPSWVPEDQYTATDLGPFRDFDQRMAAALGVPVHWEDREFFLIRQPKGITIEKIKEFLSSVNPGNH